jgi:Pyruvate/2-oxoacid:ferredoxin oxidoreductase gamma subunit
LKLLGISFEEGKAKLAELYAADVLEQNVACLQQGFDYMEEVLKGGKVEGWKGEKIENV